VRQETGRSNHSVDAGVLKRLVAWRTLLPGESVNSWVVRLARANALSLHDLGTLCLQRTTHSDLTTDLDTVANVSLVRRLATVGGELAIDLQLQSLSAHRHLLCTVEPSKPRTTRWVLDQRRTRGQYLEGAWTQACLACLASDNEPYFRYLWRLAFVTECPVHHVELIDRCPACNATLDFTVSERRLPRPQAWHPLSRCTKCAVDLRDLAENVVPSKADMIDGQDSILQAVSSRWAILPNGEPVWVGLFLDGCYGLLRELRRPEAGLRLGDLLAADGLSPEHRRTSGRDPIERLEISSRRILMHMLYRLLAHWPSNFVSLARRARFSLASVRSQRGLGPFWLDRQAHEHLDRTWYSPSANERNAAREFLRRRGLAHGKVAAAGLVGKATPSQPNGLKQPWSLGIEQPTLSGFEVEDTRRITASYIRRIATILRAYCMRKSGGLKSGERAHQLKFQI
jgi:hypothetical protein